jgi:hypothetical protein
MNLSHSLTESPWECRLKDKKQRPPPRQSIHDLFLSQGYRLIDDAWGEYGRRTYLHDDDLSRGYIGSFAKTLTSQGWVRDRSKMREFVLPTSGEIIELEPGGSEANGHFLHYMNQIEDE